MADKGFQPRFTKYSPSPLKTPWGTFNMYDFVDPNSHDLDNPSEPEYHTALTVGEVHGKSNLLVRIHSRCHTGEAYGDLECDCGQQRDLALQKIQQKRLGIFIYLNQEGKGNGLLNKTRAGELSQREGIDMHDAYIKLGLPYDARNYDVAVEILRSFEVKSPIRLLTNNPGKLEALVKAGFEVVRVPLQVPVTEHNIRTLRYRRDKEGHMLELPD